MKNLWNFPEYLFPPYDSGHQQRLSFPWNRTFTAIKNRCKNADRYAGRGIKCRITPQDIYALWLRDGAFSLKYPAIDRIDNDGDYYLDNCRFIEREENTRRAHLGLSPVGLNQIKNPKEKMKKLKTLKQFIRDHGSKEKAAAVIGVPRSTLHRWDMGKTKPLPLYADRLRELGFKAPV